MSRKQYKMFAVMIAQSKERFSHSEDAPAIIEYIENRIADICAQSNDKFDYNRFRSACKRDS